LECGDRNRRFALPRPQSRQLRLPQGKAATAVAALQNHERRCEGRSWWKMLDACVIDLDRSAEERDGIFVHGSGRGDDKLVVAMGRDGNSMRRRWDLLAKSCDLHRWR